MMELLLLLIFVLSLILLIGKYKAYQEKHILASVSHIIKHGYMHDNRIHVVDLCRFSDSDDVNEAYLFFNRLQRKGKIEESLQLIGTNSESSYRRFDDERKGVIHHEATEVAM